MSATLYALASTLTFSPGYTTAAECLRQSEGACVSCFPYDPERTAWTAFFLKTPGSGFGSIWNFPNESVLPELRRRVKARCPGRLPATSPAQILSRLLRSARAASGACAIIPPKPPEVTPPPEPDPKPDPASIETKPSDIQVGCKQYTKVAGLTWVERESTKPDSFADVSVGPNDLQESKDKPTPLAERPAALPPKAGEARSATRGADSGTVEVKTAPQRGHTPPQYAPKPEPLKGDRRRGDVAVGLL